METCKNYFGISVAFQGDNFEGKCTYMIMLRSICTANWSLLVADESKQTQIDIKDGGGNMQVIVSATKIPSVTYECHNQAWLDPGAKLMGSEPFFIS